MFECYLGISTPKIEKLIQVAKKAGALGASLHGTGGGLIAYAPGKAKRVARAIEQAGGIGIAVHADSGLKPGGWAASNSCAVTGERARSGCAPAGVALFLQSDKRTPACRSRSEV